MKDRINYYIFLPVIFLLFFLETTFIAQIFGNLFPPNLVFIFLLASIFLSRSTDFIYTAFTFGFLFDLFSGSNFGIFTLTFVLSAAIAGVLKEKFLKEENYLKVAIVSAGIALVYNLLYLAFAAGVFNANLASYSGIIWEKTALDLIYAAILVYPAMSLIHKERE